MFSDVFVLKKGAWHSKLMKYTWGIDHTYFSHICPYFWISVFNVMIAPVFVPVKFTFKTILPRYFFRPLFLIMRWCYKGVERFLNDIGDVLERWAIESQERWEAKRKAELQTMEEVALERLLKVPEKVIDSMKRDHRWRSWELDCYRTQLVEKKQKKWLKWFDMLVDMHRLEPAWFDKLLSKKEQYVKEKESGKSVYGFNRDIDANQDENQRAEYEESARIVAEMREIAKMKKVQEAKRLQALREKERDERERLERERAQARMIAMRKAKERINRILKIVKPIATAFIWILGGIATAVGLYLLYKVALWIGKAFSHIPHKSYVDLGSGLVFVAKWLGIIAAGVGIVVGIIFLIKQIPKPNIRIPKPRFQVIPHMRIQIPAKRYFFRPTGRILSYICRYIAKSLKILWLPFVFLWKVRVLIVKGIGTFFRILVQTIKNNCPAIEWKD